MSGDTSSKRYDLVTNYRAGSSIEEMERSDDGEWIRWEDVASAIAAQQRALVVERDTLTAKVAKCVICGKPASCFGVYEQPDQPIAFACDACCGHGNEDGWCKPIDELLAAFNALTDKVAAEHEYFIKADEERLLVNRELRAAEASVRELEAAQPEHGYWINAVCLVAGVIAAESLDKIDEKRDKLAATLRTAAYRLGTPEERTANGFVDGMFLPEPQAAQPDAGRLRDDKFNVRRCHGPLVGKVAFTVRTGDGAPFDVYLTETDAALLSNALASPAQEPTP